MPNAASPASWRCSPHFLENGPVRSVRTLVVPLIHFILMSYLPIGRMRSTLDPASECGGCAGSSCSSEDPSGSTSEVTRRFETRCTMASAFREFFDARGHATDIFDGTDVAGCRMYHGFLETWRGFAKNAYEGLGNIFLLVLLTILHLGGHVAPWFVLVVSAFLTPERGGIIERVHRRVGACMRRDHGSNHPSIPVGGPFQAGLDRRVSASQWR